MPTNTGATSKFAKRHYDAIVTMLNEAPDTFTKEEMVMALATMFEDDNQTFNRRTFMRACGFPMVGMEGYIEENRRATRRAAARQ